MNRLPSSLPSIAVSVVIRPSRILLYVVAVFGIALLFIAAGVAFTFIGDLPLSLRILVVCLTLSAAGCVLNWLIRQRKIVRLDISMNGQIRLVEHNGLTALSLLCRDKSGGNPIWQLMPDSVLWSCMLLLRLKTEERDCIIVLILRDSINARAFRTLSVACRWIAAQNNPANSELT